MERQSHNPSSTPVPSAPGGFTLVELMIVVALIGLLVGLGGFMISGQIEGNRISQMNRELVNLFTESRSHAMRTGTAVAVEVQTASGGNPGSVRFSEAQNGGNSAQSCARSTGVGGSALAEFDVADYGVENLELDTVDPGPNGGNYYCINPNGRVVGPDGGVLGTQDHGCTEDDQDAGDQMNLLLLFIDSEADDEVGDLSGCESDSETDAARELAKFSMIHVGYGGQVRVIR